MFLVSIAFELCVKNLPDTKFLVSTWKNFLLTFFLSDPNETFPFHLKDKIQGGQR